ncbi:MAG: type II secretion system secretin GspD [Desulfobacteraceae bacterium]|nr:type II secretion system secretin GspD [Desulfobacteraceae bacterium]
MKKFQRQRVTVQEFAPAPRILLIWICLIASAFLWYAPVCAQQPADANDSQAEDAARSAGRDDQQQYVSIDFNEVDINVFVKFISELTGRNFVVDPRVKGKITIVSPSKISVDEAYKVFESVLEVHGYATVDAGRVTKVIPAPYARTKSIETKLKREADSADDKVVTQVIHLKYADPNEIKQAFAPLVSKSSVIISYPPTNMLIVTDVYSNIKRLMGILDTIDVQGTGREIAVIPLEHADAEEMVSIVDSVFTAARREKRQDGSNITAVADPRTNILVVRASEPEVERIKDLVANLDREVPRGKEKIHVYYLENAKAEELVSVLQELPSKETQDQGKKEAPIVSESVKIAADEATNSLIIRADKDDYNTLASVIKRLDMPRAMVYIECLIMEVSKDKSFRLGAEWLAGGEASHDGREGVYGGGFSGGAMGGDSGYNYVSPSIGGTSTAPLPPGFSLGVLGENIEVGDITFPTIRALIQAYKKDRDVHILSTPQVLTTDNKTAKIRVGKNIPYLTRAASGDTNYSNYEYKDVGILLEITPQISKDRKIRLDLLQEVTKLETTTDQFQPTTLKRTIETTVEVNDKNTVVIGGLIDESLSKTEYRVPCLGSIPGLGWLFKSMAQADEQTNLFVFLTPRVMAEPGEAAQFYEEKKEEIAPIPGDSIKLYGHPENNEGDMPEK